MAKQSGLGDQLFIAGYDISGDVGAVTRMANPSTVLDVTGISSEGHERIHGLYDGEISFNAFFNDADDRAHEALAAKGSGADRVVSYFKGSTIGNMAAGLVAKQVNYDWQRGQDGSLVASVQALGNGYGLDYGQMLTAGKRTDTEATNGSSLDGGAATALGLAAYLQVFAFSGTDVTISLEDSANNSDWTAISGAEFTEVTAGPTAERIVLALTADVRRYVRVVTSTTGGFTSVTFAVSFTRNPYQ